MTTLKALQQLSCPAAAANAKDDLNKGQTRLSRCFTAEASLNIEAKLPGAASKLERIRLRE